MSDKLVHDVHDEHAVETFDSEINVRSISIFLIWLVIGVLVTAIAMYGLYRNFQSREMAHDRPSSPLVDRTKPHLPPEPRLQITPHPDLERFKAEQQAAVSTYGWVDEAQGVVRIPVDRAMDIVAARGLPWKSPSAEPAIGQALPESAPPAAAPSPRAQPVHRRGQR